MRPLLVSVLFLALLPTSAASTLKARITLPTMSPVSVRGTGFKPGERVTVTVSANATRTTVVNANAAGSFRATFTRLSIGYCELFSARARGNRGSVAFLKVIPECAQPKATEPDLLVPTDPRPKR